jgi:transcriptional regulator with XRE-family HTH domain
MLTVAKRRRVDIGFGRRLRELREAAGLTQTELADKVGMVYQAIAKYERAATEPSWSVVVRLADAMSVSTDDFREPDTDQPAADDEPEPAVRSSKRK